MAVDVRDDIYIVRIVERFGGDVQVRLGEVPLR
jgi:hypothetical protein